ncbi:hypothetical protein PoB_006344600 [Plakobranchus ocellatus]|uniref:Uncharacterized protein n=1 Tax=Plakobranchus ocellatus TaxID=259542 RepID=A0AAV4CYD5_9GAST|nr:hypothetical protein PoB_006344600 [Plakobranchus ocellatus]
MRKFLGFSSRAPRPPRSPTKGTHCAALQRCVRATWSYTHSRGCGTSTGIDPSPIQRKMTSRLGSVGQRCPPV